MFRKLICFAMAFLSLAVVQSAYAAVEINTADQAQLDGVAGIGPSTSRAILDERKKNGNFKDWNDLEQRVRGIGERNSVKLSAAGLTVNGQSHSTQAPTSKPVHPVKAAKVSKETKGASKNDKESRQSGDADN